MSAVPLNKADYKYWKPWLPENNLPKWAEDIQDKPIHIILGDLDKDPWKQLYSKKKQPVVDPRKTIDVSTDIDFGRWKCKDVI